MLPILRFWKICLVICIKINLKNILWSNNFIGEVTPLILLWYICSIVPLHEQRVFYQLQVCDIFIHNVF